MLEALNRNLKKSDKERVESSNVIEGFISLAIHASVFPSLVSSPAVVTNVKLDTPECLRLACQLIRYEEIRQCDVVERSQETVEKAFEEKVST